MVKYLLGASVLLTASVVVATPVHALSTPAIGFTEGTPPADDRSFNLGYQFTVNAEDITVDQLGYYDFLQDGLAIPHPVGIFLNSDQSLVISATVPSGTMANLTGFFRYVAITPTVLSANTTYRIAGLSLNNSDPYLNTVTGFSVNPQITYNKSVFDFATALAYPSTDGGVPIGFFGGNFTIATTPVPFEFSPALGLGVLGGLFAAKKLSSKLLKK